MISPEPATLTRREATFIASPIAVYCSARVEPIAPVITLPVLMPMPMRIGGLVLGGAGAVELLERLQHRDRARDRLERRVVDRDRRAEQADDLVADELVERAGVLEEDVDHHLEVLVERVDDLLRRATVRHRREAADVGEQHRAPR